MRTALLVLMAALVGGCDGEPAKPRVSRKERAERSEQRLAKTPQPRTYRYPDAEMRVFQVPVPDGYGFVEQQQCIVWRDFEFKTSTISCSVPPEVIPATAAD